jgi:hypothetical protein
MGILEPVAVVLAEGHGATWRRWVLHARIVGGRPGPPADARFVHVVP